MQTVTIQMTREELERLIGFFHGVSQLYFGNV